MPEGPEIRRAADRIAAVLEATPLLEAEFTYPRLADWGPRFSGHHVTRVQARGKAMLLHIDSGHVVYSHNQLYGKWVTRKTHTLPKTKRSLRIRLLTERGAALLYSASDIDVWDAERIDEHPFLARLGPDVLDEATDTRRISAVLRSRAFQGRALGGLFLDQRCLAGLGNYLRSEILFEAGVHPSARPKDLDAATRRRLCRAVKEVTVRAYERAGVTLTSDLAAAHGLDLTRRGTRHHVFARANKPCLVCGTPIEKTRVATRRLYLCPTCQPKTARG